MSCRDRFAVAFSVLWLPALGCSSGMDVRFDLVEPCGGGVIGEEGCLYMEVAISSLDPNDRLHCEQSEPISRVCAIGDGSCSVSGENLKGPARMVDVLCYTDRQGNPVARATSGSLDFETGSGGVGGSTFNLLLGAVNDFIPTTSLGPQPGTCSTLATQEGRYGHAAVDLEDGRVLITGGIRRVGETEDILATAEIFDPATGIHEFLRADDGLPLKMMASSGRAYHTATRLRDGTILLAGGVGLVQGKKTTLQSAELFNPVTGTFGSASIMGTGRAHHTATTLNSGEVLIVGGVAYANGGISSYYDTAILYAPQSNSFSQIGSQMSSKRAFHQTVQLDPNQSKGAGQVLVIGGEAGGEPLSSIELFNPETRQFAPDVDVVMKKGRSQHCAARLANGEVMVVGGRTGTEISSVDSVLEIFTPWEGLFGIFQPQTLSLQVARMDHTCTLLETGNVVIAGGLTGSGQTTAVAEQLRVNSGTYSLERLPGEVIPTRFGHTATRMRNGWVFLTGGLPDASATAQAISQSLLFVPPPGCE